MQFQKGDIVLKHGFDAMSIGIETVTHSLFSHVAIIADPIKNVLYEAEGFRTVGERNLNDYKGECIILRFPNLTDDQVNGILDYIRKQFGKPYDYKAIFKEFERYIFGVTSTPEDDGSFICSTLINSAFLHVGLKLTDEILPSPDDIYKSNILQVIGRF